MPLPRLRRLPAQVQCPVPQRSKGPMRQQSSWRKAPPSLPALERGTHPQARRSMRRQTAPEKPKRPHIRPGLRPRPLRRPRHPTTFQYLPKLSEASRRCPRIIGMKPVWRLAGNAGDLGARRGGKGKGCGEGGWRREGIPCSVCERFFRRTDHGGADFRPHHENLPWRRRLPPPTMKREARWSNSRPLSTQSRCV